jgi:peroxiredoxin
MRKILLAAAATLLLAAQAHAALKVGAPAPTFSTEAAVGGQAFKFDLASELKKGPVVLYFYPKAFTSGCTAEAHDFAEATPQFQALGATVVGMSNDNIDTLKKFSVEECRNKFAVAADEGGKMIKAYDVSLVIKPDMADRVSFLIAPDGRVAAVHSSMDPSGHVKAMLEAVKALKK